MANGSAGGALVAAALIIGASIVGASYLVATSIDRATVEIGELKGAMENAAVARAPAAPTRSRRPDPNRVYKVDVASAPVRGDEKAPITIVEWADFQ